MSAQTGARTVPFEGRAESKAGVRIDPKRQDEPYGRFAWVYEPDGNRIELCQPIA